MSVYIYIYIIIYIYNCKKTSTLFQIQTKYILHLLFCFRIKFFYSFYIDRCFICCLTFTFCTPRDLSKHFSCPPFLLSRFGFLWPMVTEQWPILRKFASQPIDFMTSLHCWKWELIPHWECLNTELKSHWRLNCKMCGNEVQHTTVWLKFFGRY